MSYSVSDYKWGTPDFGEPSGAIPWAADLSSGLDFDDARYDLSDFTGALDAAMDAWEAVASVDFAFAGPGTSSLTFGVAPIPGSAVGTAGISYQVLPGTDRITSAGITFDSTVTWAPYGSGGVNFYAVALHEIGHALGLNHVNDPSEIMNPVISTDTLGDGDIAGIQLIYGRDPGDAAPPSGGGFSPADPSADGGDGGGGAALGLLGALMALIALLFGGAGAGAGVAMAAGRVPDADRGTDHPDDDGHGHSHAPAVAAMGPEELMAALSVPDGTHVCDDDIFYAADPDDISV